MTDGHSAAPPRARLLAVAGGVAATFSLFAASLTVPLAGFVTGLLAPYPAAHVRLMYGRWASATVFLGGLTAVVALFGLTAGLVYLLQCSAVALLLPELILRQHTPSRAIIWSTAATVSAAAAGITLYAFLTGIDIRQAAGAEIRASIAQALQLYEKSGVSGDDLSALKASLSMAADLMVRIYPALATLVLGGTTAVNCWLLFRISAVKAGLTVNVQDLKEFKVPEPLVWLLIAAGFALLAPSPLVGTPAQNVVIITCALYFFQGLAVTLSIISRQALGGVLRIMFWLMLVLQPYLAAVITAIGIFDLWVDFRRPRAPKNL